MRGTAPAGVLRSMLDEATRGSESSAEETTTSALRQAIIKGLFAPGDRLRQEVLAAEMGVSRIPLRDAFRRLEAEGLIHIDGRRGARVASLSIDDVAELYELRRMLEVYCIRLAVRNVTDEGIQALLEIDEHMDVTPGHILPGGVSRRGFFAELYGWSGRPRMVSLILQLRHEVNRYHALKDITTGPTIHAELQALISKRDADGAARLMRDHLRTARDALVAGLRREERLRINGARRRRRAAPTR